MLSLKASRADNFYYGTVEDEKEREKRKKEKKKKNPKTHDEIKFEIPYTIICNNCKNYIYKGERFNSKRTKAGYYLSTPFYSFLIYCKHCPNTIVFETNPKDCSYDIKEGARQKNENFDNVLTEKGKKNFSHFNFDQIKRKRANPFLLLEQRILQNKNGNGQENLQTSEQTNIYYKFPKDSNDHKVTELATNNNKDTIHSTINEHEVSNQKESEKEEKEKDEKDEKNGKYGKEEDKEKEEKEEEEEEEGIRRNGKRGMIEVSSEEEEEDMKEVIKETYRRNEMLKCDYNCNSNLRKQLRNIKKYKIKKREEKQKKNLFINILEDYDTDDELKVKKFALLSGKYKKKVKMKKDYLKSIKMAKKSSIFDKKYLKKEKVKQNK